MILCRRLASARHLASRLSSQLRQELPLVRWIGESDAVKNGLAVEPPVQGVGLFQQDDAQRAIHRQAGLLQARFV